jgi:hypothetical protein
MHASAPAGETIKRSLTTDDTTALCTIYAPGTLPEACDPAPRGGLDLTCAPPGNCGCRAPGTDRGALTRGAALAAIVLVAVLGGRRLRRPR